MSVWNFTFFYADSKGLVLIKNCQCAFQFCFVLGVFGHLTGAAHCSSRLVKYRQTHFAVPVCDEINYNLQMEL